MKYALIFGVASNETILLKRIVDWKQEGYELLIEYDILTGVEKIITLSPDLLIITDLILFVNAENWLQYLQNVVPKLQIIALTHKSTLYDWKAQSNLVSVLYMETLTAKDLLKALRKVDASAASTLPVIRMDPPKVWEEYPFLQQVSAAMNEFPEGYLVQVNAHSDCSPDKFDRLPLFFEKNKQYSYILNIQNIWYVFLRNVDAAYYFSQTLTDLTKEDGCGYIFFMSENLKNIDIHFEFYRLKQMNRYRFFCLGITLVSERYISVVRMAFNYQKAGNMIRHLLFDLLSRNERLCADTLSELYLQMLKTSFDLAAWRYCRNSLQQIYLTASILMNAPKDQRILLSDVNKYYFLEEDLQFIIDKFSKLIKRYSTQPINPKLMEVISIVEKRFHEDLSLKIISNELGISKSYLSRLFSQSFEIGFVDYVNCFRIMKACECIADGHIRIAELARLAGFWDPKYFSRVFKRFIGSSPSEYIQAQKHDKSMQ